MIRWLEKNRYIAIIFTFLIALEIFYISSIPGYQITRPGIGIDITILYHFIVFFLLSFFLLTSIKGTHKIKVKHIIIVLSISIAYALLDEFHQMFVPLRYADLFDILTDAAGIFLAILLYVFVDKEKI